MRERLGQHFLKNSSVAETIAHVAVAPSVSTLIEVGPGHGELTRYLLTEHTGALILIEKDPSLARELALKYQNNPAIRVELGDVREDLDAIVSAVEGGYSVVGNIPYYLTSYLLRQLGELEHKPRTVTLLIQKEVAERIAAQAPAMNKLAAHIQVWAVPKLIRTVPRGDFKPAPDVDSAVIQLSTYIKEGIPTDIGDFINVIFQQPRKTLENNLLHTYSELDRGIIREQLASLGLSETIRAQDLTIEQIISLAELFSSLSQ